MELGYQNENPSVAALGFSIPILGGGKAYAHRLKNYIYLYVFPIYLYYENIFFSMASGEL